MGPMTGRGLGNCAVPASGGGTGFGRGFGRGTGWGRGIGWRPMAGQAPGWGLPVGPNDLNTLREEAAALEAELQRIRQRMDELS